jgi:hypothetical protein
MRPTGLPFPERGEEEKPSISLPSRIIINLPGHDLQL